MLRIVGHAGANGEESRIGEPQTITANMNTEFIMKLMKALSPFWRSSGRRLNIGSQFYFSHLWPPTLYGLFSQALALTVFNKNFAYFQHSIYGLQRSESGIPLCVGVISDMKEGMAYFKGLSIEDLTA
jgi:hypothetical protein